MMMMIIAIIIIIIIIINTYFVRNLANFHIHTVHLDIIKSLFIHQLMHW